MSDVTPGIETTEYAAMQSSTIWGRILLAIGAVVGTASEFTGLIPAQYQNLRWVAVALMAIGFFKEVLTKLGYMNGRATVKAAEQAANGNGNKGFASRLLLPVLMWACILTMIGCAYFNKAQLKADVVACAEKLKGEAIDQLKSDAQFILASDNFLDGLKSIEITLIQQGVADAEDLTTCVVTALLHSFVKPGPTPVLSTPVAEAKAKAAVNALLFLSTRKTADLGK